MKKRISFICLIVIMFHAAYPVLAEEILIDRDILEKIMERQDSLEKKQELYLEKIEQLEKELKEMKGEIDVPDNEDIQYLKEDTEEIFDRLDVVEKKSILDKIQFGGEFRTRLDSFRFDNIKMDPFGGEKSDEKMNAVWTNRLRLYLRSDITENLIFHARLNYGKLWGTTGTLDKIFDAANFSVSDSDGKLNVERAYVDFFVPKTPLSITFGRLPTVDGPPYEYKNYTTRKATWSRLFVDTQNDGIIANLSLDKWTNMDTMFRLGYTAITQQFKKNNASDNFDPMWVTYAAFESKIPGIKDSLFWLGYYRIFDVALFFQLPKNIGDSDNIALHLQFDNIRNSGLDWFAGISRTYVYAESEGIELEPGYEVGFFGDSLNDTLGENREGYAVYAGLRYTLPIEKMNYPLIGFEYNYASKYNCPLSYIESDEEIANKLKVKGHSYEAYYIQPIIKDRMFCRLGMIYMDYNYFNPMVLYGDMPESDMAIKNFYFLTDIRF